MKKPEDKAREQIDRLLVAAGWQVQDMGQHNLGAGPGVAVREFPLATGAADYLLFVDRQAVGAVEAKPAGTTLSGVAEQSGNYLTGLPANIPHAAEPLPFAYESTGNVNISRLNGLALPLPPLLEQRRILEEVERCPCVADRLQATVGEGLQSVERLRQSILKRVFEGKLVPQDPNDEPAQALLARIRAEKALLEREGRERMRRSRKESRQLKLL